MPALFEVKEATGAPDDASSHGSQAIQALSDISFGQLQMLLEEGDDEDGMLTHTPRTMVRVGQVQCVAWTP